MAKKVYELTEKGVLDLKQELTNLHEEFELNNEALAAAKAQGDLSENADYSAAREKQGKLNARIKEIEEILNNYKLIVKPIDTSSVQMGSRVTVEFLDDNSDEEYEIVGTIEADPFKNRISNESPLGQSLIGHKVDEILTVACENGTEFQVKIVKLQ